MNQYIVQTERLAHNLAVLRRKAGDVPIWAVVKGNGYGLGVLPLARFLREQGICHFCVTETAEAEALRGDGFEAEPILMLRDVTDEAELRRLLSLHVTLTIGSSESADRAERAAAACAQQAQVHLKIDTGMGRYGFFPHEREQITAVCRDRAHLTVSGIYTHFNCAFADDRLTRQEFAQFCQLVEALRAEGIDPGCVHCCNSAAFLKFPEMHCDAVRLGSAILGRMPFPTELQPVGYAESAIESLRMLPKGHTTGYAAVWRAKRDTRVAIVPVGWYHGLCVTTQPDMTRRIDRLRGLLSAAKRLPRPVQRVVEIHGMPCTVIGALGMLHCAVDVTDVSCALGDRVTLSINPLQQKAMEICFR